MKTNFTFYLKSSLMVLFLCLGLTSWGQVEILNNDLKSLEAINLWSPVDVNHETGGGGYALFTSTNSSLTTTTFDASSYTSVEVEMSVAKYGTGNNGPITVLYSLDGGVSWNVGGDSSTPTSTTYIDNTVTINETSANMVVRFTRINSPSQKRFRDVVISGIGATYDITATSNNTTFGTVSVIGNIITATPTAGYMYATPAYTILSGNATVTQNGDEFTVNATEDTAIQINFEEMPTYTLSLIDNSEVYTGGSFPYTSYAGDTITLPTLDDCGDYIFAGWDTDNATTSAPTYQGGASYTTTAENVTLYAVYGQTTEGGEAVWEQVTSLNDIIAGTYVILNGDFFLPNTHTGAATPPAKVTIGSKSVSVSGTILTGTIDTDMQWTFTGTNSEMAITSFANSSDKLYNINNNNGVRVHTTDANWAFEVHDTGFAMKTNNRYCAVYTNGSDWRSYTSMDHDNYATNNGILDLYKLSGGSSTTYTTAPDCDGAVIYENGAWTGTPGLETDVIIRDLLIIDETNQASFSAKTLTLEDDGGVLIEAGYSITVQGAIEINNGGDFIVDKGANLVQIDDVANTGDITVHVTAETEWFGYNMFSSPVAGQSLGGIFTNGENNGNEYLTYSYTDENTHGWGATTDTAFGLGLGYMFAAPMTAPLEELASYNYEFTGVPNNGTVELSVSESFIAIGNPYPSAIDADEFMSHNNIVGAIHIWRNSHFYNYGVGEYAGVNYITINGLTTVGAEGGNIEAGQGFVVATDAGTIEFTNEMRLAESAGVFYKPASSDKHILWLNLYNENNMLNQIAVGYAEGATEGYDNQMDAKMFGYAGSALYSIITGEQDAYAIQGRSLPFTNTDAVALGFRAAQAGTYTVSLADFNGLFANGQDIYLKDNATQTYHDLKDGAYTFVSEQGIFESRFEVVYQADGELSTNVPTLDNSWIVYSQDNGFQIETQGFELKEVLVYDMLGRLVYNNQAEGTSHTISNIANGVLIVKVITTDNQVLTRKTAK